MDDDTNQDTTPEQPAATGRSAMRILPEVLWGTPNGGHKALETGAVPQPAPDGARGNLDEWYPESWWAWKRGSGSRGGARPSTTAERSPSDPAGAIANEKPAAPGPVQDVETGPEPDERPLFDEEELGSLSPPTLDDEFAFLAPPEAFADPDPQSPSRDEAADTDEPGEEATDYEEPEAEEPQAEPEAEPAAVASGHAIAWDASSDQVEIPDQWVFGGSRFGGPRRKRSARPEAEGPKPVGKRSRLRRRHAELEPSPLFGPEEEGEALVSASRDEAGRA